MKTVNLLKKIGSNYIALFFICLAVFVLINHNTVLGAEAENTINWIPTYYVDEFGDVMPDSDTIFRTEISGDFSNTATTGSELGGYIFIAPTSSGEHYLIDFRLFEYKEYPVTYSESDNLTLKIKVDDIVEEFLLSGYAPNGDLRLGVEDIFAGDKIYNYLYEGKDIKCVIYIDSSKYNFVLESGNFADLCETVNAKNEINSTQDVLNAFMMSKYYSQRTEYIESHIEDYEIVTNDELVELISRQWLSMTVETMEYDDWWIFDYTDEGIRKQTGRFEDGEYKATDGLFKIIYVVENGILYVGMEKYSDLSEYDGYQFRKMQDGFYLVEQIYAPNKNDKMYLYIFAECDEYGNPLYEIK